ncbi:D-glycerate dehydrogenase [Nesterenkonia sp.]|uniref:2-hydroxyacid dehydrogenase n=1 Tax=Nesterenkonia sp. TaxID=704201 RepID=UPI00262EB8CC|nr:D-glycerate dehydrogenase [Nesterenkonia sp.]
MSDASHVYITRPLPDQVLAPFEDQLPVPLQIHHRAEFPPNREELLAGVSGAVGVLSMVTDRIDGEVLDAAGDQLKIVANMGVGYDNIDLDAAAERSVVVTNTPGVLDETVADLALALILATVRRVAEGDRFIRTGKEWIWGPQEYVGLDVSAGAVLGIVGLGRIGMATARRAAAFGMRILATGSRADSEEARELGVQPAGLDELLASSDVVSLHCPLKPETHHLIGADQLAAMKPGSYLINTARGPLVDEEALADALEAGHLAGAGLDVHEHEPQVNQRLARRENVVVLPHIGSAGDVTRRRMATLALENLTAVLGGKAPITPVG